MESQNLHPDGIEGATQQHYHGWGGNHVAIAQVVYPGPIN
jgi:hypothetical protein